jgi:hypothetical protein
MGGGKRVLSNEWNHSNFAIQIDHHVKNFKDFYNWFVMVEKESISISWQLTTWTSIAFLSFHGVLCTYKLWKPDRLDGGQACFAEVLSLPMSRCHTGNETQGFAINRLI